MTDVAIDDTVTPETPDPPGAPPMMQPPSMPPEVAQQLAAVGQHWNRIAAACRPDQFVGTIPAHEQLQQSVAFIANVLQQAVTSMQVPAGENGQG